MQLRHRQSSSTSLRRELQYISMKILHRNNRPGQDPVSRTTSMLIEIGGLALYSTAGTELLTAIQPIYTVRSVVSLQIYVRASFDIAPPHQRSHTIPMWPSCGFGITVARNSVHWPVANRTASRSLH